MSNEGPSQADAGSELSIALPQELMGGVWANFAAVSHSQFEFTLDFARLDFTQQTPGHLPGIVVARVNVSPLLISQLMEALRQNWENYAEKAMPREVRGDAPGNED